MSALGRRELEQVIAEGRVAAARVQHRTHLCATPERCEVDQDGVCGTARRRLVGLRAEYRALVQATLRHSPAPSITPPAPQITTRTYPVTSSFIREVQYDSRIQRLTVVIGTRTYTYDHVSRQKAWRLRTAPAPGAFYNRNIRGQLERHPHPVAA